MSWIKVTSNKPGKILVKKIFNELENRNKINIFKKGVTKKKVSEATLLILLCKSHIIEDKNADLKNMIGFLVKPEDKLFYEHITS